MIEGHNKHIVNEWNYYVFSHSLWSDNWGIHTEYRVAYSPILTRVESDNKKYLLAKESCQTPFYLRGGSLSAEFVGPEDDCFMGTISLKDLVFIPLLNTLNILLHIYDRKLCAWPGIWPFWRKQVPSPPSIQTTIDSPIWSVKCLFCSTYPHLVVVYD